MRTRTAVAEAPELPRRRALSNLDRLYAEHAAPALRFAFLLVGDAHLAEDLVQDAFLRMFGRFRHLRDPDAFGSYLNRTIVNLSRDYFRRRALEAKHLEAERDAAPPTTSLPDVAQHRVLIAALQTLPVRQRAAVIMRHHQDLSERQVADALECSLGAAKALIARGMEKLRKELEENER
ncbi:MAG: RNA polymerase sigma factor [Actinomycetota bacterium]